MDMNKSMFFVLVEKAGIIKKNRPVVIGPFARPFEVFERVAKEKEASLLYRCPEDMHFSYDFNEENKNIARF